MGVSISLVLIPASQLGIRAKVNDYLGSFVGVELRYTIYLGLDGKRVRSCIHFCIDEWCV